MAASPAALAGYSEANRGQNVSLASGEAMRANDPEAASETQTRAVKGPHLSPAAVGFLGILLVALAGGVWFMRAEDAADRREQTVITRSAPVEGGHGTLRVEVNVPAKATLDGWHLPDAGAQAASALVFSNVEATTHTLEVWSEGYRRESSSVVVRARQTSRIAVNLQRDR